jgi:hypothetical protein
MNARTGTERILDAYLAPEADRLPDRVIDAALDQIARTPQRRALRVPWRLPTMSALTRATGIAAVALVAVVGAGGLIYLNASGPGGPGGRATPAPTPGGPGITSFTTYTSAAYGITFGYPDGWTLFSAASRKPQPGEPPTDLYRDLFINDAARDGDSIAFGVWQQPAEPGDVATREALAEWLGADRCEDQTEECETVPEMAMPMCLGKVACLPAILVPLPDGTLAAFADADAGLITLVALARHDTFPATARYGGGVQLLKSILTTMDVWTPEPGQIPG